MSYLFEQLLNGLSLGCIYAFIALGYTMVYGIIQLINFAHGEVYMIGAFTALIVASVPEFTKRTISTFGIASMTAAAAELAVPVRHELIVWVDQQEARMRQALSQGLTRRSQRLRDMGRALPRPDTLLETPRQLVDTRGARLAPALIAGVQRRKVRLADISGYTLGVNPFDQPGVEAYKADMYRLLRRS